MKKLVTNLLVIFLVSCGSPPEKQFFIAPSKPKFIVDAEEEEKKLKIVDIMSEYQPDDEFLKNIIEFNIKIENENLCNTLTHTLCISDKCIYYCMVPRFGSYMF